MALSAPSLLFDITDDFLVFDNREVVEYRSKQAGETFVDPDVMCLVRHGAVAEPELSGAENQVFHVRPKALTYPPKPRDEIIRSDGTLWVVNDVNLETFGTRYRLGAVRGRGVITWLTDDAGVFLLDE